MTRLRRRLVEHVPRRELGQALTRMADLEATFYHPPSDEVTLVWEVSLRTCAIPECHSPVVDPRARYCSEQHRKLAYSRRTKAGHAARRAKAETSALDVRNQGRF